MMFQITEFVQNIFKKKRKTIQFDHSLLENFK